MKVFIAFLAIALAATEAVYTPEPVSTSVWPPYGVYGRAAALPAWPHANNGWNSWNERSTWGGHGLLGHPYGNRAWSPAYGQNTVVHADLGNAYPYGLPLGTYGVEPYGHKTVVQANLGQSYPYGLPWGSYGAEPRGWAGLGYTHGGYLPTVVPVSKQLAATPGSVHVADVPVGGARLVYA